MLFLDQDVSLETSTKNNIQGLKFYFMDICKWKIIIMFVFLDSNPTRNTCNKTKVCLQIVRWLFSEICFGSTIFIA